MTHEACASYTGGHAIADQKVSAAVRPLAGTSHLLSARAGGAMRGYFAGFDGAGKVSILKNDFGFTRLTSADFTWEPGRDYRIGFEAIGDKLSLSVDGKTVLEARDGTHTTGMVGCGTTGPARALYGWFEVEEL
jgi:hypothetical protein